MPVLGLALRKEWWAEVGTLGPLPHVELIADNLLDLDEAAARRLEQRLAGAPRSLHCIGLDLGSADPLDTTRLARIEELVARWQPVELSAHLCFLGVDGIDTGELLPLPRTPQVAAWVAQRVRRVQRRLGRRIALEHVARYPGPRTDLPPLDHGRESSAVPERGPERGPETAGETARVTGAWQPGARQPAGWLGEADFVRAVVEQADCDLLLDVANLWVVGQNHGFDPQAELLRFPLERVRSLHLAGPTPGPQGLWIDSHGAAVPEPVLALARTALAQPGCAPRHLVLERDRALPTWSSLQAELGRIGRALGLGRSQGERVAASSGAAGGWGSPPGAADEPTRAEPPASLGRWQRSLVEAVMGKTPRRGPGWLVYQRNLWLTAFERFAAVFPGTRALLGDRNFKGLLRAWWCDAPPARGHDVERTRGWPAWLAAHPALQADGLPFVGALARLDHAITEQAWRPGLGPRTLALDWSVFHLRQGLLQGRRVEPPVARSQQVRLQRDEAGEVVARVSPLPASGPPLARPPSAPDGGCPSR